MEVAGYVFVLFLFLMEPLWGKHRIGSEYLIAFLLASLGYGVLVNVLAVLVGAWRFRGLWDAWRSITGWEKFARVGFHPGEAPIHG